MYHALRLWYTIPMDRFIAEIKRAMVAEGVTITELARRAQTHRTYLHRVFAGSCSPSLAWCHRVADAVGVEVIIRRKERTPVDGSVD